ncbi:MAG: hypothetical protein DDT42_02007 [candidate division WS2 bacterium]|uniref:Uncharacterized protein n=1 Tax=Psychracetigena formicireducens TaxID=2986056 RepID=A0A9E2BKC4_PSYF1|nr:hypothetical protein [Candidatus Psychracetigena formicireducens]
MAKHVEFTAGFLSRLGTVATDAVSYVVENQFLAHHIEIRLADNLAGLGAATPIRVRAANLNIAKNVESDDILGSIEPSDYVNKQVEITGDIELLYEDTTFKSLFLAGTPRAMRIDIRNPGVVLETGVNPQLRIELARVQFPEWTRAGALNDIVSQSLSFKALYSLADAQAIRVILTNTQATY